MIWSVLLIVAEVVVAASLASTRPFLASLVIGLVVRAHAPDLPDTIEWLVSVPVLGALLLLAAGEHFLKWRQSAPIFDLPALARMPGQLVAVLIALSLFELLRIAGPEDAVELLRAFFDHLGSQLASAIVHLIVSAAVAALAAWLSARHQSAEEWVVQAGVGARWVRHVEAILVVAAALAAALAFWALAAVAVPLVIGIGLVAVLKIGRRAVEHGARTACATCGYRRAPGASVCARCRSVVEGTA